MSVYRTESIRLPTRVCDAHVMRICCRMAKHMCQISLSIYTTFFLSPFVCMVSFCAPTRIPPCSYLNMANVAWNATEIADSLANTFCDVDKLICTVACAITNTTKCPCRRRSLSSGCNLNRLRQALAILDLPSILTECGALSELSVSYMLQPALPWLLPFDTGASGGLGDRM